MSWAGARSRATGSGTSRRISVPAGTIMFARSGMPWAVMRPSEISFWTWLLERPVTSATYRSIRPIRPSGTRTVRTPPAMGASGIARLRGLTWPSVRVHGWQPEAAGQECAGQQQEDGAGDGAVRDVEGVEAQVAEPDVHEIDDVSKAQAVDHVPERSPEQQAQRHRQQGVPPRAAVVPGDQPDHAQRYEP